MRDDAMTEFSNVRAALMACAGPATVPAILRKLGELGLKQPATAERTGKIIQAFVNAGVVHIDAERGFFIPR